MKKFMSIALLSALIAAVITTGCTPKEAPVQESTPEKAVEETAVAEEAPATEVEAEAAVETHEVFVTPEWIYSVIEGNEAESENFVILEGAWGPVSEDKAYLESHIPGAVHLNTDDIEEPMYWNLRTGEEIAAVMAQNGITKDTTVIVYGNDSGAARVAFTMLWAGVENVKLLDGGYKAWLDAGLPTEAGEVAPTPTTEAFGTAIPAHPEWVLPMVEDVNNAFAANDMFRLVSIRSLEEFKGTTSGYGYIERAGEPEGALWGHDEFDYYNEDGTFISIDQAAAMWNEQGITEENQIAFYCGTGWRATIPFLIAYNNGWENVQLFDGGWFVWQMDEKNPVQAITPEEAAAKYNN